MKRRIATLIVVAGVLFFIFTLGKVGYDVGGWPLLGVVSALLAFYGLIAWALDVLAREKK